jgi:hypothetical protein
MREERTELVEGRWVRESSPSHLLSFVLLPSCRMSHLFQEDHEGVEELGGGGAAGQTAGVQLHLRKRRMRESVWESESVWEKETSLLSKTRLVS